MAYKNVFLFFNVIHFIYSDNNNAIDIERTFIIISIENYNTAPVTKAHFRICVCYLC